MTIAAALRAFTRSPGFAVVVVMMLTLGIGTSTALFGVLYGVLLKPLPYRDADRLVIVRAEQDFDGARQPVRAFFPTPAVEAWPTTTSLERVAFFSASVGALAGTQAAELVNTAVVTTAFFKTVDGTLVAGRALETVDNSESVVVISDRLSKRRFNGAADAIGKTVTLNGQTVTIIGVAAATFQIPEPLTDIWLPHGFARVRNPDCCGFTPIARLASGVSMTAAADEVAAVAGTFASTMPRAFGAVRTQLMGLGESITGQTQPALLVLAASVALLLVLACANVMNLLLARNTARLHEAAVRRALGASRRQLIVEALVESALLATAASIGGVGLAAVSIRALKAWSPTALPRLDAVAVDGAVLLFAIGLGAVTAVAVGILPGLQSGDPASALKDHQRGTVANLFARFALRAVTVTQLAIAVILIVGAVLLGRSLIALTDTDLGVATDHVATASLNLAMDRTLTDQQQIELVDRVLQRISQFPQVTAAGVGSARPPNASRMRLTLNRSGDSNARASFQAAAVPATPGYFSALGIRLERGRLFTAADDGPAPPVVIMSAGTARLMFPEQDALGRTIPLPVLRNGKTAREEMTVVGIVADVKYNGLDQVADAVVYRPFAQQPHRAPFLVVRTSGDPAGLVSQLQSEIGAVDRGITMADARTMNDVLSQVTLQPRLRTLLLAFFASLAIVIAAVGVYAVIGYSVSQRTAEIGVRLALGAQSRQIRTMVMREGLILALVGGMIGLGGAYALSRLLTTLLYGIAPADPASFALGIAIVLIAGLTASCIPAVRAARTDPVVAIRGR
ncbi:MAG TPA: ABC transporter permease [Vicinamibacterales bacterium]|nr:ABC transporter permease [Vicinamibacterales bacterium]